MVVAAVLRWAPALRFAARKLRADDEAQGGSPGVAVAVGAMIRLTKKVVKYGEEW